MPDIDAARRPLESRDTLWANALASRLARWQVSPNAISLASLGFALAGALAMLAADGVDGGARTGVLIGAAICIQLRLVCNLLDGMVAIEGGLASPSGAVFNELPDRIADPLLIVPAGYLTGQSFGPEIAWTVALLALLTANVRMLGASLGAGDDFQGPMAKPHRMAAMTLGLLLAAMLVPYGLDGWVLLITLCVLLVGSGITVVRRTRTLLGALERP